MTTRILASAISCLTIAVQLEGQLPASTAIRINQIGFYPSARKVAIVAGSGPATFVVVAESSGDTVLRGRLGRAARWAASGESVRQADLSRLRTPGRYALVVGGVGRSHPFAVDTAILRDVGRAAVKAFYYQRASMPLDARYAGRWSRAAGHPDTAVLIHQSAADSKRPAGSAVSSPGGWYDAGDYNKYIVNSGISTYTLLLLAEQYPEYAARLETNIPESGGELPDVLDETLWNIRWMLTMQDPADGGVYHKLTNAVFDAFERPDQATAPRYVVQKSTAAALDFAAVMAHASLVTRLYPHALPALPDSLIAAAKAAWSWAQAHPDVVYDQTELNKHFQPAVLTGEYGDRTLDDERSWAGAELYAATAEDSFYVYAAPIVSGAIRVPSWGSVGALGLYTLVDRGASLARGADTVALKRQLLDLVRPLVRRARTSPYAVPIGDAHDWVWGSNAVAANQGLALIQAYRLTHDSAYLDAAVAALDYLLGRNPTGYSFVTGYGAVTPRAPHHRPSASDTVVAPVPGLLVGGPNPGQQDGCGGYPSRLPALSYLDHACNYAANEIAINWNAPFAFLALATDAIFASPERRAASRPLHTPHTPR